MSHETTPAESFQIIEQDLGEATIELFKECGITLDSPLADSPPVPGPLNDTLVASVIGYAGETVRGALLLFAASDTIRKWQPCLEPDASLEVVHDKIGEFCNMLLGRLKYRMMLRGVSFLFGTPTTTSGASLSVLAPVGPTSRWLRFGSASGTLSVRLDVVFEAGFALKTGPISDPPAPAGEMFLF